MEGEPGPGGSPLPLGDMDFQNLCKDLLRSGEISSDGELTEIAKQEISRQTNGSSQMIRSASDLVRTHVNSWIKTEPNLILIQNLNPVPPDNPTTCTTLTTEEFGGPLGLEINAVNTGIKSKEAHYSESLRKIYINQNRFVNIEFRLKNLLPDSSPIASDLFIRAVCIFVSADDFAEPVRVCYTHCRDSSGNLKCEIAEHLVRCSHSTSLYEMNQCSGRHSVITPFPEYNQQPGSEGSTCQLAYKFMDLGSCSGGLNRRETALIFTLEDSAGKVIGRRLLHLRICTCPKRDFESEEKAREKQLSKNVLKCTPTPTAGKQQIMHGGKRKALWVLAYGEENYHALQAIAETLEKKDGGDVNQWKDTMKRFNNALDTDTANVPKKLKM